VDDCHFDYIAKPLKETLVGTLSLSLWNSLLFQALIYFMEVITQKSMS
jgi:hypothetical protein